jgi:hypothetical protein
MSVMSVRCAHPFHKWIMLQPWKFLRISAVSYGMKLGLYPEGRTKIEKSEDAVLRRSELRDLNWVWKELQKMRRVCVLFM